MTGARLRAVRLDAYTLPLKVPWRTARGALSRRAGWVLRIEDNDGVCGLGECAPMPAAGTETIAQARSTLDDWCQRLRGGSPVETLETLGPMSATPAARCAVESALMDLLARRAGAPLRCWLGEDRTSWVRSSANVGSADAALTGRCAAAVEAGFKVLKVKLGVYAPSVEQDTLTRAAGAVPPGVSFRLDANGAWDAHTASGWLTRLAGLPIESLEEPLAKAEPADLLDLQRQATFPLALDESASGFLAARGADAWPVARLILKPMVFGGAGPSLAAARQLAERGIEIVVTTTLEAAPGRWLCAHLAAVCGRSPAHGLDTGRWLERDLGEGPTVVAGVCRLGSDAGLGFVLA